MPLREHLAELRGRVIKSGLAVLAGSAVGWTLYERLFVALQQPLKDVADERGITAGINFTDLTSAFNLQLKLSVYLGLLLASPVWLYQAFAFVLPGLTRRERLYALGFTFAATPLFAGGIAVAWLVIPNAVTFLADFAPTGSAVLTSADTYFTFVLRLMLVFGLAFLLPLVLIALNLVGILSAASMAKSWRLAVFLVFLFAAIASPSPEVGSMLMLAFPMVGLYLLAVGIAWILDARRARRSAADPLTSLSDDEASTI